MPDGGLSQRVTEQMLKGLLRALAEQPARGLEENCRAIERQTASFARAHEMFFATLGSATVPEEAAIEKAPNGSLYQTNRRSAGSSFFVPRSSVAQMGEEEWEFARKSVQLDERYRQAVENTPNVVAAYFNADEPADMNRYYPFIERPWEVYPTDLDMKDFNFFFEADAEHNPERKTVWTGIYADPAGRGWMLSCISPVYCGDVLKGVVGLDVTFGEMLDSIVKLSLPGGASSLLVAPGGRILAHTDRARRLLGLEELEPYTYRGPIALPETDPQVLRLDRVADLALREELFAFLDSDDNLREIPSPEGRLLVAQAVVPTTGWRFWLVVRRADLLDEVDELAGRESRLQSELHARERELSYVAGLWESAAAHLHDIGNAVTILESSLMDLNKLVKSSEQYPEAFRLIREGGEKGAATLQRFEEVLTGKNVPALKAIAASITRLKQRINDALSRDLAAFKAATKLQKAAKFEDDGLRMSEDIDLPQLLGEVCAGFGKRHAAVEWSAPGPVTVRSHRAMLKSGLDNIIRNAVQASSPGGVVRVACEQTAVGAIVTVTDQGRGITAADLKRVSEPGFTTKADGHGLGLHYFRKHLEFSGGKLEFFSAGRGQGTRVTVAIIHA
jgi:signal transduction histidine kinase